MSNISIVPAGAGAGKTHKIETTLAQWVRDGIVQPERILAVTFTEAAAGELRQRIRAALVKDSRLEAALAVDRAYITTIHGLGRRLLIEHAFATGASPQQRLIAEDEQDLLIRRAIEECDELGAITRRLSSFGYRGRFGSDSTQEDSFRSTLLNVIAILRSLGPRGLDPQMADFAEESVRIGYGETKGEPDELAQKLKEAVDLLLKAFPASIEDCAHLDGPQRTFRENYYLLRDVQRGLLTETTEWSQWQKLRLLRKSMQGSPTPTGYDVLADQVIAAADALACHPGPLEAAVEHARVLVEGAQTAMKHYEARKRELGVIDFSDMVTSAAQLLASNPDVLASVMAEIDCVIVDEFQDTNPIQFTFLWHLAQRAKHALVVGDTKQAIMGFQGADPRLSQELERQFETSPLEENWRSDPRIMDFVNALGDRLFSADYQELTPRQQKSRDTALEVIQLAVPRRTKKKAKPQHFVANRIFSLLHDEQVEISDRHNGEMRPLEPRDIAILCPTNPMCRAYAATLRELGLPVRVAEEGWWSSPVIQAAVFALRYVADPDDRHAAISFTTLGPEQTPLAAALQPYVDGGVLCTPSLEALQQLSPFAAQWPLVRTVAEVIRAAGLRDWCDALDDPAQMRADLLRFEAEAQAFLDANRDMREASGFFGVGPLVFLGWLEYKVSDASFDKHPTPTGNLADGVEVVTWHSSKGREWPVVIVCGLDHNREPRLGQFSTQFDSFAELDRTIEGAKILYNPSFAAPEANERFLEKMRPEEEETTRRLLYVALTRARNRLIIEWPKVKDPKEGELPISAYRLLAKQCGIKIGGAGIGIGTQEYDARQLVCTEDLPGIFDEATGSEEPGPHRQPRYAIAHNARESRDAILGPSKAMTAQRPVPTHLEHLPVCVGIQLQGEQLTLATEKGTAIHEAFRILLLRPDMVGKVGAHCQISESEVAGLVAQARGLRECLQSRGFHTLHVEQPLEITIDDGGSLTAIIDLLAESDEGYWIVDHKSGPVADFDVRYATYWPQLAAYADAVETLGNKPVTGATVFWTDTGTLSVGGLA